jgi:hypothetical protein
MDNKNVENQKKQPDLRGRAVRNKMQLAKQNT